MWISVCGNECNEEPDMIMLFPERHFVVAHIQLNKLLYCESSIQLADSHNEFCYD